MFMTFSKKRIKNLCVSVPAFAGLLGWLIIQAPAKPSSLQGHRISLQKQLIIPSFSTLRTEASTEARVIRDYGNLPLSFEPNQGQSDAEVRFFCRGDGYSLFLTPAAAVLRLRSAGSASGSEKRSPVSEKVGSPQTRSPRFTALRMRLLGANRNPEITGLEQLPGKTNYFIGAEASKWRLQVPTYAKVRYRDVYPGVDQVYYGNNRKLEYDFVIAPGADPKNITIAFDGSERLELASNGDLIIHTKDGELLQHKPQIYQEIGESRHQVNGRYLLKGKREIGFQLASYDSSRTLIIDPVLAYSTYLGGNGDDDGRAITVDAAGNAYVTGETWSTNFPLTNPLQAGFGGGQFDIYVAKLNASGSALVYSTYIGGSGDDRGFSIAVDGAGNAYFTGRTDSPNFPTANAFQPTRHGSNDAYVTKLNPAGSALVYSTYLGGTDDDRGLGVVVDSTGNAYVTGIALSADFPTVNPLQAARSGPEDAFVAKLNPTGLALSYSTYLGGSGSEGGRSLAVDSSGNVYVTGQTASTNFPVMNPLQPNLGGQEDGFVTKLNSSGSAFLYSTYLGGGGSDQGFALALDGSGNAYIVGTTNSNNFPTTNSFQKTLGGLRDAFVTKLNSTGSAFIYSTYLGGSGDEFGEAIAVDSTGHAFVTGDTTSGNFPTANPLQICLAGGLWDAFVAKLSAAGTSLSYSTYLGGSAGEFSFDRMGIAVDPLGNAYVTGHTASTDFPTKSPIQPGFAGGTHDAFVTKINPGIEIIVHLANQSGQISMTISLGNATSTAKQVELRLWVDSPSLGVPAFSLLGQPVPIQIPVSSPPFEIVSNVLFPTQVPVVGTTIGGRLHDQATGEILAESICKNVPCN
jgi:hypothetical protein